jgi:hypothetical protein
MFLYLLLPFVTSLSCDDVSKSDTTATLLAINRQWNLSLGYTLSCDYVLADRHVTDITNERESVGSPFELCDIYSWLKPLAF